MQLPLGSDTIIGRVINVISEQFAETVVVTDEPHLYAHKPVRTERDVFCCGEKNSLTGIHAGLVTAKHAYCMVVAGDMPFVRPELIRYLCELADGYDVTIPQEGKHFQPLCAIYHKNCLPYIEALLQVENYKVANFFTQAHVRYVDAVTLLPFDQELYSFFNINTSEDYQRAQIIMEKEKQKEIER